MMAKEYNETTNKLTNKDLKKLGLRSMFYQTGFTFEKMQGNSFGWSILPGLEKIHGKDSEEVSKALDEYGVDFINTEQHAASFLMGLVLSMEENKGRNALFGGINNLKFKKQVVPGDRLKLEVKIIKRKGPIGIGEAIATVDGKIAVKGELTFAIV